MLARERTSHVFSHFHLIITHDTVTVTFISQIITLRLGDVNDLPKATIKKRWPHTKVHTLNHPISAASTRFLLNIVAPPVVSRPGHQRDVSFLLQSYLALGGSCSSATPECPNPSSSLHWGLLMAGGLAISAEHHVTPHLHACNYVCHLLEKTVPPQDPSGDN